MRSTISRYVKPITDLMLTTLVMEALAARRQRHADIARAVARVLEAGRSTHFHVTRFILNYLFQLG